MRRKKRQVTQSALAEPGFRRYFPASWFSGLGSWMLRFLLGWSAWELTASATWVGLVAALMLGPALLLSPWFGILSDRINPRHGLIASMLVHAAIALSGAGALWWEEFDRDVLVCLAVAMGVVTSGHSPMRLALIPMLVDRAALPSAVGLSATTFNIARILGPALGALLLARAGAAASFTLAAGLFAVAALILISLRQVGQRTPRSHDSYLQQFRAGLRYVGLHPGIQLAFACTVLNGLLGRTVVELLPALAGGFLGGDSTALAILTANAGVGSIVGGLVMAQQRADNEHLFRVVMLALLAASVLLLAVASSREIVRLSLLVLIISGLTTIAGTGSQTITQLCLVEEYRGRVMSLWTLLAMGAPALGSAVWGVAADKVGFPSIAAVAGTTGVLLVAFLYGGRQALSGLTNWKG